MVQLLLPCIVLALPVDLSTTRVRASFGNIQDPVVVSDPSPSDIITPTPSADLAAEEPSAMAHPETSVSASDKSPFQARGCWSGSWMSCKSGHHGVLRATLTPCGDQAYRAEFRGRFFKIMPFRYSVNLQVISVDDQGIHLAGSQSLGRLFGTFHYQATINDCRFEATYRSCKDWGKFSLGR